MVHEIQTFDSQVGKSSFSKDEKKQSHEKVAKCHFGMGKEKSKGRGES